MSIISTPSTNKRDSDEDIAIVEERIASKKVLEEDEYLGRMAKIIRRDFFPDSEFPTEPSTSHRNDQSEQLYSVTPGTDASQFSTTSSLRSRYESCNMGLNEFLKKYTSEDNAYFEKLQRKDLKRHRLKYPWLYEDKTNHTERVREQLKLPSASDQSNNVNSRASNRLIDWPHNPKNSLFYPPKEEELSRERPSTVNYNSNRLAIEHVFKEPLPSRSIMRTSAVNKFSDKIGIDGKLLNGLDTPTVNGYSFIPPPETPKQLTIEDSKFKQETNRFYIPCESPRDELAHRVYQEKVAKNIRTPSSGKTPSRTPSYRKGMAEFSFSPERVKNLTPSLRHKR